MTTPFLSIIIPAYNEEHRLPSYLARILSYLEGGRLTFEIIVVDDGSTDGTARVAERAGKQNRAVTLLRLPANRGKGYAVRSGMLRATGSLRLFADADGATPIGEVARLIAAVEGGADVAIASRAMASDCCTVRAHLHRKAIGAVFNLLVSVLAVRGIEDTQCGFKLFTARAAEALFPLQRIDDFGFDVELLFLSRKLGLRVCEVPVNWNDVRGSKVSLVKDSLRMLADLFAVRCNDLAGRYRGEWGAPLKGAERRTTRG